MANNLRCDVGRVLTIDDLPDDDLLAIFDFYVFNCQYLYFRQWYRFGIERRIDSWQSLVYVCRRWRGLVFQSPRRLNLSLHLHLQIYCKLAMKSLDVWPALPLLIHGSVSPTSLDNAIAVLEHRDRISQINLELSELPPNSQIEKLWTAMEVPFPELAALCLSFGFLRCGLVLPDSFLGGSAPRLRNLSLRSISFPGLSKLLSSTTELVNLRLQDLPYSAYFSPEAMVTCLSMLTSLETFRFGFEYAQSYPDLKTRRPFPPTRSVLPTLTNFWFKGPNEYLEEFVARIDAPQLSSTTLFDDIDIDTPELNRFISRTVTLGACDEARFVFHRHSSLVRLRQSHPEASDHRMVEVSIIGPVSNRQLSTLAKICALSLHLLLTVENLYIDGDVEDDIENTGWLDVLLPFTAVKNLYVSKPFSPGIARVLQRHWQSGGRTIEVLPALQNVLLEGFKASEPVQTGIARFISARQLTNHPVAISVWDRFLARDKS